MRRYLLPLAALPMLALALGCDNHQAPSAPVEPAAPSFRAERLPAFNTFELGGFPSNPLAVLGGYEAGVTAEDVCANPGDRILFDGQKGQDVFTPPGGFHEHVSAVDVNLVVYEFAEGPISGPCQLPGAPVVGTGAGKFTENTQSSAPGPLFSTSPCTAPSTS